MQEPDGVSEEKPKKKKRPPKNGRALHITLEDAVIDEIDRRSGGPHYNFGRSAGRNKFVRAAVYTALGWEAPDDPHTKRHLSAYGWVLDIPQEVVDALPCERKLPSGQVEPTPIRRIVELTREGLGLQKIAETLGDEGYPTRRGRPWARESIRLLLSRIADNLGVSCPKPKRRKKKGK